MLKNARLQNIQASMEKRASLKITGNHKGLKVRDRSPLQNSKIMSARIEPKKCQPSFDEIGLKRFGEGKVDKNDSFLKFQADLLLSIKLLVKNATRGSIRVNLSIKTAKRRTSSLLNIKYNEKVKKECDDLLNLCLLRIRMNCSSKRSLIHP
ncbi:unnamed protein product [Moneuplotes crassus]|uniref:Uncharacterized protein n=1 Tax=Euplotes crassus TaxID=5936 RepID=A0AAD1UHE6_EUPCR|nr:unnamed protein product [Moneuplotes crassus]